MRACASIAVPFATTASTSAIATKALTDRAVRHGLGHRQLVEVPGVVVVDRGPEPIAQVADAGRGDRRGAVDPRRAPPGRRARSRARGPSRPWPAARSASDRRGRGGGRSARGAVYVEALRQTHQSPGGPRLKITGGDPEASVRPRPHARAGDRRVRAAEAAAGRGVGRPPAHGEEEPHTSVVVPSLTLDQSELRKISGGELLRGAAALPPHPPAQPAGADGLRHLAARPPDHPRVLLPVPGRHPGEPRPLAPHAAVRRRRLAALADREDPRAAAPHRADPRRDRRPAARLPDGLQLDAARAQARGAARHPVERRATRSSPPRHEVGEPQGLPRGGGRAARGLRGPAHGSTTSSRRSPSSARRRPGIRARGRQARRELLRRGQRALPLSRDGLGRRPSARRCASVEFSVPSETPEAYFDKFAEMGGIVEEFIEAPRRSTRRSAQLRIGPRGEVAADLDPRPDPRRPERPGLPRLPLPRRATSTGCAIQEAGSARSGRCSRPTAS